MALNPAEFWTMTEVSPAIGGMTLDTRRGTITFRRRYNHLMERIGWEATAASVSGRTRTMVARSRRFLLRSLYRWMKCN